MQVMALRGGFVETAHPVRVVAVRCAEDGTLQTTCTSGTPAHSPWRSAGKHLQAWTCLEALGDPDLSDEDLAIAVSSHSGEPRHLAAVRSLLARFDIEESALRCGAEAPMHGPSRDTLIRRGDAPQPIHSDCSGKHALMLAASAHSGWGVDYLSPSHPLQARIAAQVAAWTGEVPGLAGDGCGVPTFYLSVAGMARCWAKMAAADDARMARIAAASMAHPALTSGVGRIDLALSERVSEPFFCKIGAGGVFCMALPERRLGIALKVISGNEDALAVAAAAALESAAPGSVGAAARWPWAEVRNVAGLKVGWRVATGRIRV